MKKKSHNWAVSSLVSCSHLEQLYSPVHTWASDTGHTSNYKCPDFILNIPEKTGEFLSTNEQKWKPCPQGENGIARMFCSGEGGTEKATFAFCP
jgi:hypothetical protein